MVMPTAMQRSKRSDVAATAYSTCQKAPCTQPYIDSRERVSYRVNGLT